MSAALAGLEADLPRLGKSDRRASQIDRRDAIRRLEVHETMGHLDGEELRARIELVRGSRTPNQISKVFDDLPALGETPRSAEPRIGAQDKAEALDKLKQAHAEGRIEENEYAVAMSQVTAARTPRELDAAFRCLPPATRAEMAAGAARQTAALTSRIAIEGGRRARRLFIRLLFALTALLIGVVLLIAGVGIGALLCFVLAVLLLAAAGVALVSS